MKNKHYDCIVAWAEGKQIQVYRRDDNWITVLSPSWHFSEEYRIKPEPKPDRWSDIKLSIDVEKGSVIVGSGETVRIHYDGETGKLKSAEVL